MCLRDITQVFHQIGAHPPGRVHERLEVYQLGEALLEHVEKDVLHLKLHMIAQVGLDSLPKQTTNQNKVQQSQAEVKQTQVELK